MAPHHEEQAPPSGGSLALSSSGSYSKHERPGIGLEGSGLPSAVGSESPEVAVGLNAANLVAPLGVFFSTDEMDPELPRFENAKHVIEVSHLKALEVSVEEDEWRVHLAKEREKQGSDSKLVSAAAEDDSAEEEEDSPSRAAEAAFSNKRRKKTMQLLKRARRKSLLERGHAAAGATSGCSRPLDWSDYDSWSKPSSEDGGGVDLSCWHDRHHMYEDLGYGATVTDVVHELHRYWAARAHSATSFSAGARRAARRAKRLARREQRLQEGETYYLSIERDLPKLEEKFAASGGVDAVADAPVAKTWSSDVEKVEATLSLYASASEHDEVRLLVQSLTCLRMFQTTIIQLSTLAQR